MAMEPLRPPAAGGYGDGLWRPPLGLSGCRVDGRGNDRGWSGLGDNKQTFWCRAASLRRRSGFLGVRTRGGAFRNRLDNLGMMELL